MPILESGLYEIAKLFLAPVLLIILGVFLYAFYALGGFLLECSQRLRGQHVSELMIQRSRMPDCGLEELELWIMRRIEPLRLVARTAPLLGLVATMIPMGPALMSLSEGDTAGVSRNLVVAFAAVIIALISASITFVLLTVRRRWLLTELREAERQMATGQTA